MHSTSREASSPIRRCSQALFLSNWALSAIPEQLLLLLGWPLSVSVNPFYRRLSDCATAQTGIHYTMLLKFAVDSPTICHSLTSSDQVVKDLPVIPLHVVHTMYKWVHSSFSDLARWLSWGKVSHVFRDPRRKPANRAFAKTR